MWSDSFLRPDFISKLLVKDNRSRLSAVQCLQHPWLASGAANAAAQLATGAKMAEYNDARRKGL